MSKFLVLICLFCFNIWAENLVATINSYEKQYNLKIGVAGCNLQNNKCYFHRGNQQFRMASSVKLPLAIYLLNQIENKKIDLEQLLTIKQKELIPGTGIINIIAKHEGVKLSVYNLMEMMLAYSDNTAADKLFQLIGGYQSLRNFLFTNEYNNIWVSGTILSLFYNYRNYQNTLKLEEGKNPLEWHKEQPKNFLAFDYTNSTSPKDMVKLLGDTARLKFFSRDKLEILFNIMSNNYYGGKRIRKYLAADYKIYTKTGSYDTEKFSFISDVGFVTDFQEIYQLAIFVEGPGDWRKNKDYQESIAQISKELIKYLK